VQKRDLTYDDKYTGKQEKRRRSRASYICILLYWWNEDIGK
jgi:hypothetical protein